MTTITKKCFVCCKYDHKTFDCKSTMWGCTYCHEKFETKTESIKHEKYCGGISPLYLRSDKYLERVFIKLREQHSDKEFKELLKMAYDERMITRFGKDYCHK